MLKLATYINCLQYIFPKRQNREADHHQHQHHRHFIVTEWKLAESLCMMFFKFKAALIVAIALAYVEQGLSCWWGEL